MNRPNCVCGKPCESRGKGKYGTKCNSCRKFKQLQNMKLRKNLGLCRDCNKPRTNPLFCDDCNTRINISKNRSKLKKKEHNLCRECGIERDNDTLHCSKCIIKIKERSKIARLAIKKEVLQQYSIDELKCACCGEKEIVFLTLDHIDGGGNEHRRELAKIGIKGGNFYRLLKKQEYPPGYQVLCFNCNLAKGLFGVCPHQANKVTVA